MRHFLMLAYFFPPMGDGGVFRSLGLARHLPERGWLPRVVCGRPEDYWIRDESLLAGLPEELAVSRVGGLTGQGFLRRLRRAGSSGQGAGASRSSGLFQGLRALGDFFLIPDSYAGWIPAAVSEGRRLIRAGGMELIYSSGPPDSAHVAAERLARETGLPWVADFRDPWFNLHLKRPPTPLHRTLHRRQEARVLRRAQVVAVTEAWRRRYEMRCVRRPVLIRNGFEPADFTGLPPKKDDEGSLTILHCGKLSLTRSARPFLEGLAALLAPRPDLRARLRVDFLGPRESDNEAAAAELGLEDTVRWLDPVSHRESVARQRQADLLLLIKHDDPRYSDLVPGKFYEYIAAGRPILAVSPAGEIEELMKHYRLGWMARPERESVQAALTEALDALARGWRPASEWPPELTRTEQAGQMADLFDELVGEGFPAGEGEA